MDPLVAGRFAISRFRVLTEDEVPAPRRLPNPERLRYPRKRRGSAGDEGAAEPKKGRKTLFAWPKRPAGGKRALRLMVVPPDADAAPRPLDVELAANPGSRAGEASVADEIMRYLPTDGALERMQLGEATDGRMLTLWWKGKADAPPNATIAAARPALAPHVRGPAAVSVLSTHSGRSLHVKTSDWGDALLLLPTCDASRFAGENSDDDETK